MVSANIGSSNPAHHQWNTTFAKIAAAIVVAAAAVLMRALVLLLVGLLLLVAVLMCLTGRYDVGVLVIGGILFLSLGAANYAR